MAMTCVAGLNVSGNTIHATFAFPFCRNLENILDPKHADYEPTQKDIKEIEMQISISQAEVDLGLDLDEKIEKEIEALQVRKEYMEDKLDLLRADLMKRLGPIDTILLDELSMVSYFNFNNQI